MPENVNSTQAAVEEQPEEEKNKRGRNATPAAIENPDNITDSPVLDVEQTTPNKADKDHESDTEQSVFSFVPHCHGA